MASENTVGLDVGTKNTKAAFRGRDGQIKVVPSPQGDSCTPSVVYCNPSTGEVKIGQPALDMLPIEPDYVARNFKRDLTSPEKRYFGGTTTALAVLAIFLKHLIPHIFKCLPDECKAGVASHPANWKEPERAALLKTLTDAGLNVLQLVTEPGAAGLCYALHDFTGILVVIDVGGGTTDLTALKVENSEAVVLATEGLPRLGGLDFTKAVQDLIVEKYVDATGKQVTLNELAADVLFDLEQKAEHAKITMSTETACRVVVNLGHGARALEISEEEFVATTQHLTDAILECYDRLLASDACKGRKPDRVVMVGGAGKSQRLQLQVADHTGNKVRAEVDPGTAVAQGAARQAAHHAGSQRLLPGSPKLRETTAFNIGVASLVEDLSSAASFDDVCDVIVPRGTQIPCAFSKSYALPHECYTFVDASILEGGQDEPASECTVLARVALQVPPEPKRTDRILVTVSVDESGLATITVEDKVSGVKELTSVAAK